MEYWQAVKSLPTDIKEVKFVLIGSVVMQQVFIRPLRSNKSSHYKNVF